MAFFWRLVSLSLKQEMTYRTAMVAGLATNLFFGLLRVMVLVALYDGRGEVNGMTLQGAITFVALSQGMIMFLRVFGSYDLIQSVYSGAVATDLLKPAGLFRYWLARDLGRSIFHLFGRGILFMALFSIFYRILLPESGVQWLAFFLVLGLSWLNVFAWRFLVNLSAFWSPEAMGIARMAFSLSQLFSGFFMPLRLMPDWFIQLSHLTPFPSMLATPIDVYLGSLAVAELGWVAATQVGWFVLLAFAAQVIMRAGVSRLVVQGG